VSDFLSKLGVYAKGLIAAAGVLVLLGQSAISDGTITNDEWVALAIAAATAVGVVLKANKAAA
jgi:hypothetical protein